MELAAVSREDLLALVAEQRAVIEAQRAAIGRLEARVAELEAANPWGWRATGSSRRGRPPSGPTRWSCMPTTAAPAAAPGSRGAR